MKFLFIKYINKKDKFFRSYHEKIKDRQLVYEFFDTLQGGYHPQMEPVVNNLQLAEYRRKHGEEK